MIDFYNSIIVQETTKRSLPKLKLDVSILLLFLKAYRTTGKLFYFVPVVKNGILK